MYHLEPDSEWLTGVTHIVRYSPNCNRPFAVHILSRGQATLDGKNGPDSRDAVGYGTTLHEAAMAAKRIRDKPGVVIRNTHGDYASFLANGRLSHFTNNRHKATVFYSLEDAKKAIDSLTTRCSLEFVF